METNFLPGIGVDVGTCTIVISRQTKEGNFVNTHHRNMLYPLDISEESKGFIEKSNYTYIKTGNKYYIVGEDALKLANAIGSGEILRPMKNGILNPSLKESSELLFFILKTIIGNPIIKDEPLRFSIPANPIDTDTNNVFHKTLLQNFFKKLGYSAKPINEAVSICFNSNPIMKSIDGDVPLSGITVSCGGGMWNICLSLKGLSLVEFSCTKSGDWLDQQASMVSGLPVGKIIRIKETKLDLNAEDLSDRGLAALSIYYDEMLERMVKLISNNFKDKTTEMDGEIEIVVAGGTSLVPGFCERFKNRCDLEKLPFKIYQVRHAKEPFFAVAQGACLRAMVDTKNTKEDN